MNYIAKNSVIILLLIFAAGCLYFSTGHYSNLYIDVGREMYYPVEILNGKVLYKNLFCIYGPASYLFNALIFKIFGVKLSCLYAAGGLCGLLIVGFTFKIARKFLTVWQSFSVGFFVAVTGCLSTRIFNFTLPYSYAMVFGLCGFLISIYYLICFIQTQKKTHLILAALFAGVCVCNKYEFVLYLIPFFAAIYKKGALKTAVKYFLAAFLIPFLVLFFQGLTIGDLARAMMNIRDFSTGAALKTFYMTQGVYYTNKVWGVWLWGIFCTLIPLALIYFGIWLFNKKYKIPGGLLVLAGSIIGFMHVDYSSFLWAVFLTAVLFIVLFKKNSYCENIFIASAILVSLKSLWGLSHANYGLYFTGVIFISFLILVKNKILKTSLTILLFSATLSYFVLEAYLIKTNNSTVATDKGFLKTTPKQGAITNALIDFVNNLEEQTPYVMIFPEGLSVNFLSAKKTITDGVYNSLIPLYTEGLGEEKIVEHYKQNPPDYLVLSSFDNSDYGKGKLCDNYAEKFCKFVYQNYLPFDKIIIENETFFIFRLQY